jgi:hypothetical protein
MAHVLIFKHGQFLGVRQYSDLEIICAGDNATQKQYEDTGEWEGTSGGKHKKTPFRLDLPFSVIIGVFEQYLSARDVKIH